ncbi:MAG TPA: 50S ribosomal protein L23 [Saprospiraceae bacterium]|nr:50S ribosomal protein L23 [Saprospiraceae bacterium]HND87870.1 50S ribosomal protein L23 [Saprospiraceae bacterium]
MAKHILLKPLITEKATRLADKRNTYSFIVNKDSNKIEIKAAVEQMFNVTVDRVNTAVMPGKPKSRSTKTAIVRGTKSSYKKAYVTLTPGETIDLFGPTGEEN